MKFAETEIQQGKVYLKESIRTALQVEEGDVLEWWIENSRVEVRKKT